MPIGIVDEIDEFLQAIALFLAEGTGFLIPSTRIDVHLRVSGLCLEIQQYETKRINKRL